MPAKFAYEDFVPIQIGHPQTITQTGLNFPLPASKLIKFERRDPYR